MPRIGERRNGIFMGSYQRPTDLDQGLQALAAGNLTIIAGGTDYYPARVGGRSPKTSSTSPA